MFINISCFLMLIYLMVSYSFHIRYLLCNHVFLEKKYDGPIESIIICSKCVHGYPSAPVKLHTKSLTGCKHPILCIKAQSGSRRDSFIMIVPEKIVGCFATNKIPECADQIIEFQYVFYSYLRLHYCILQTHD